MHKTYLLKNLNSLFRRPNDLKRDFKELLVVIILHEDNNDKDLAITKLVYLASLFNFLNISPANSVPSLLIEILTSPSTVFSIKVPVVKFFL